MFILSNLAISLDGKIGTKDRQFFPLGTKVDHRHMLELRKKCDALLIGAATLRTFKKPSLAKASKTRPINVVLSSNLKGISPEWEFFANASLTRILFVGEETPASRIRQFDQRSEIIILLKPSHRNPLAAQIVSHLEARGIKRLLVEGGGEVMWQFAQLNLIDEYHVTLTPRILGGVDSPTLVDGQGFAPDSVLNLKLKECKVVKDELYLVYQRKKRK